jgi:hypothetical protein
VKVKGVIALRSVLRHVFYFYFGERIRARVNEAAVDDIIAISVGKSSEQDMWTQNNWQYYRVPPSGCVSRALALHNGIASPGQLTWREACALRGALPRASWPGYTVPPGPVFPLAVDEPCLR